MKPKIGSSETYETLTFLAARSSPPRRAVAFTADGVTAGPTETLTSVQTLMTVCPWWTNWKAQIKKNG